MFLSFSNRSNTLPLATRYNVRCVGLSPDGRLAIIVDEGKRRRLEAAAQTAGGTGKAGVGVTQGQHQVPQGG